MKAALLTCGDYVTATFARDVVEDGCDHDSAERIHRAELHEWIHALAQSGRFTNRAVSNAAHTWQHNPKSMLDPSWRTPTK
jgi:hypothetical protein